MKPQERTRAIVQSGLDSETRLIAIVIAHHMDDREENSWISVRSGLVEETGLCDRTIQRKVDAAIKAGWLERLGINGQVYREWRIHWERLPPTERRGHPRHGVTRPPTASPQTPDTESPDPRQGVGRTGHEPAIEPIKEPVKDGASAPEEPQAADAATPAMTTTSRFVESDGPPLMRLVDTNEQQRLIPPLPLPHWMEPLKGALRNVGCNLDNEFDTWLLSREVPPKEAQRVTDWLVDAKGRGKKYKSPRAFLNNWLSKVRTDGLIPDGAQPRRRPDESVRGHFPGGRQVPPEVDEDNRRAWEELQRQRAKAVSV